MGQAILHQEVMINVHTGMPTDQSKEGSFTVGIFSLPKIIVWKLAEHMIFSTKGQKTYIGVK